MFLFLSAYNKIFHKLQQMVKISEKAFTCDEMQALLFNNDKISVDSETQKRVEKSFRFLVDFSKDKIIYGINTGFGPMAQYKVEPDDLKALQYNLIRSHSAGSGNL